MPGREAMPPASRRARAAAAASSVGKRTQRLCQLVRAQSGSVGNCTPRRRSRSDVDERPPLGDERRQAAELNAADGGLNVGHAVVEAEHAVAGPVVAPGAHARVDRRVARRHHATVAGGDELARVEAEAGDVAVRAADALPFAVPAQLAACRARRVLDERHAAPPRDGCDGRDVARHSHLMHAQDRARARPDRRLHLAPGPC